MATQRNTPRPGSADTLATAVTLDQDPTLAQAGGPGPLHVTLDPASVVPTVDQALWVAIRNRTNAIGFEAYSAFLQRLLCERHSVGGATCGADPQAPAEAGSLGAPSIDERLDDLAARPTINGQEAYAVLRLATDAFLAYETGVEILPPRDQPGTPLDETMPGEASRLGQAYTWSQARRALGVYLGANVGTVSQRGLPYLKRVVEALIPPSGRVQGLPFCDGTLNRRLSCPQLLELIWSYYQESGYLVQTMNAIALRFQNSRRGPHDPLANLAIDPLRPLANLLWGWVQDKDRLTVARRALEYQYTYGLELDGKAVAGVRPVERRAHFMDSLQQLLYCTAEFYEADAITTVRPDGFKLLQALKELHLELAQSANNQYGELPRTARAEMLMMQYLLARPEMAAFLRGRAMVPYREAWMGQVDTMKRLQGWPQTSVTHFRDLADTAEKILLSVRLGDWIAVDDQAQAMNWARYWKPEIQTYLHASRAITGRDLTARRVDLQRRPPGVEVVAAEVLEDAGAWRRPQR